MLRLSIAKDLPMVHGEPWLASEGTITLLLNKHEKKKTFIFKKYIKIEEVWVKF